MHYLVDAFDLVLVRRLVGHQGLERDREGQKSTSPRRGASGEEVCFTGDSKWVISGSADGSVLFWDLTPPPGQEKLEAAPAGTRPIDLRSTVRLDHTASQAFGPCRSVRMNPRYAMMAAGGEEFVGLLPATGSRAHVTRRLCGCLRKMTTTKCPRAGDVASECLRLFAVSAFRSARLMKGVIWMSQVKAASGRRCRLSDTIRRRCQSEAGHSSRLVSHVCIRCPGYSSRERQRSVRMRCRSCLRRAKPAIRPDATIHLLDHGSVER